MSKGVNCLDNSVLAEFLGVEGIEELRTKVIDVIVEEIRNQLNDSCEYIISPNDVSNEIFDRCINDIYDEISDELKKKVTDAVQKRLETLGI